MNTSKYKILILVVLVIAFLSYSVTLYFSNYKEKTFAGIEAQRGKMIWQQNNCTSCHQIYGLGGHLGPDLTNIYAEKDIAIIRTYLKNGGKVMPNFHLKNEEINDLIAYLKYINTTGISNPKSFTKHINGSISQP